MAPDTRKNCNKQGFEKVLTQLQGSRRTKQASGPYEAVIETCAGVSSSDPDISRLLSLSAHKSRAATKAKYLLAAACFLEIAAWSKRQ